MFQALEIWPAPLSTLFADKEIGGFRTIISDDPKYTVVSDEDPTIQKLCRAPALVYEFSCVPAVR